MSSEVRYYGITLTGEFTVFVERDAIDPDEQAIKRFHHLRNQFPQLRHSKLVRETREDLVLVNLEEDNEE